VEDSAYAEYIAYSYGAEWVCGGRRDFWYDAMARGFMIMKDLIPGRGAKSFVIIEKRLIREQISG